MFKNEKKILMRLLIVITVPILSVLYPIELVLHSLIWVFTGRCIPENALFIRLIVKFNDMDN